MSNMNNSESSLLDEWQKYLVLGAIGTSFVGVISLTSPFILMQLKSPLPYMSTPRSKVLTALEHVSKRKLDHRTLSKISHKTTYQRRKVFYDLGSGDGEAVLAAASAGWKSIGIEMNPTLYVVSQIRRLFSKTEVRKRSTFILGDMFSHDIQSADAVMIFGVKPLMPRIASKIKNECDPGTFILSYRFILPTVDKQNNDVVDEDKNQLYARRIFDEEEMRIWIVDK